MVHTHAQHSPALGVVSSFSPRPRPMDAMTDPPTDTTWSVDDIRGVIEKAVSMTCPRYLREHREDIVQEAHLRLMRAADLDDPRFRTRSYLWKAAHCAILDAMRVVRRRSGETLSDASVIDETHGSGMPGPGRETHAGEIAEAIRDCLHTLIESRRRIVTLNLYGYGMTEIAGMLGEDRKRIDNLLNRGMANLRECLMGKGMRP